VGAIVVAAAGLSVAARDLRTNRPPVPVIPRRMRLLTWNTNAVQRGSRLDADEVQTDGNGLHVVRQAGVYDGVTKARGPLQAVSRLLFAVVRRVGAGGGRGGCKGDASTTTCPTSSGRRCEYTAYLANAVGRLSRTVSRVGEAAATTSCVQPGDGWKAATPSYGGIGSDPAGQVAKFAGLVGRADAVVATSKALSAGLAVPGRAPPALTAASKRNDL